MMFFNLMHHNYIVREHQFTVEPGIKNLLFMSLLDIWLAGVCCSWWWPVIRTAFFSSTCHDSAQLQISWRQMPACSQQKSQCISDTSELFHLMAVAGVVNKSHYFALPWWQVKEIAECLQNWVPLGHFTTNSIVGNTQCLSYYILSIWKVIPSLFSPTFHIWTVKLISGLLQTFCNLL